MRSAVVALLIAASIIAPAAASAAIRAVPGAPAPGPARYDKVWIETFGPANAAKVLVLVPGTGGGVGSLAPVAADIAARVPGLQVWTADRREEAFEDTAGFRGGDLARARDYYLGFKYRQVGAKEAPYAADWGLKVALDDLRRIVLLARDGGRRQVILGGHSRGASTAAAYAAWDFNGRPGYRDLAGLVLIDGGLLGAIAGNRPTALALATARTELAAIRAGKVFNDPLGAGIPSAGPIFAQLAALHAVKAPDAPSPLQDAAIVPADLKPPYRATNEAFLGNIFDDDTSLPSFRSLRLHGGNAAASGDPRPWISGEQTPLPRFARAFARERGNATEWYFPNRLILDISAANAMGRNPASALLGLRLFHTRSIDVPLYAFQTDLTFGAVAAGARRLAQASRTGRPTIVSDTTMSHLDPVLAIPSRNTFTKTVVPFLKRIR